MNSGSIYHAQYYGGEGRMAAEDNIKAWWCKNEKGGWKHRELSKNGPK